MTGVLNPDTMDGNFVVPPQKDGIRIISCAMFKTENSANILRGPMASSMITQFLTQVRWGELDYLIIDYPPGTSDIQLTLSQVASIDAAILVTTPQEVATIDCDKAAEMFNKLNVPVVGVIETMSFLNQNVERNTSSLVKTELRKLPKNTVSLSLHKYQLRSRFHKMQTKVSQL